MSPRNRSLPNKRPFLSALFWSFLYWCALCCFFATLVALLVSRDLHTAYLAAAALAGVGVTWLISFVKRRGARCPLCQGTPYINTGAETHEKAVAVFPFNHGITAMLSTIFTMRFRCMYCATRYDILKPSHRKHHRGKPEEEGGSPSSRRHRRRREFRG